MEEEVSYLRISGVYFPCPNLCTLPRTRVSTRKIKYPNHQLALGLQVPCAAVDPQRAQGDIHLD